MHATASPTKHNSLQCDHVEPRMRQQRLWLGERAAGAWAGGGGGGGDALWLGI